MRPAALSALNEPFYIHTPPVLLWRAGLSASLGLVLVATIWLMLQWRGGAAGVEHAILSVFVMLFGGVLLRPATWRLPISFAADPEGIHFMGGPGDSETLFVPWREVGPMSVERLQLSHGVGWALVLPIALDSLYWEAATNSRFLRHILQGEGPPGFRRLPLGLQGRSPSATLRVMEALRSWSTE